VRRDGRQHKGAQQDKRSGNRHAHGTSRMFPLFVIRPFGDTPPSVVRLF
jgi:hypothetical protein